MTPEQLRELGIIAYNQDGKVGIATQDKYGFTSGTYGPLENNTGLEGIDVNSLSDFATTAAQYGIGPASKGVSPGMSIQTLISAAQSNRDAQAARQVQEQQAAQGNLNTPGFNTAEQQNAPGTHVAPNQAQMDANRNALLPQGVQPGQAFGEAAQNPALQQTNAIDPATGQPMDATLSGQQVGGRLGTMQFGRVGNDVFEIMSDGSRRKVTEAEFSQKLRMQGLNLDVLPQLDLNDNISDTPGGTGSGVNLDGTPKGPSDFITDYKNTIKDLGLSDIKAEFEKTKQEYIDLRNKKNGEIADINDNPWLSEGLRLEEIEKINTKYELKENTISNLQKTYESMYEEGIAQAKFIATGLQEDRNKMLDLALKREEAEGDLPPGAIGEYVFALSQGYMGSFMDYQNEDANRKASTTNGLTDAIKSIQLQLLQKELETGKPPTDAQRSLGGFASRIEQSNPIFSTLEKSIVGMSYPSFLAQINSPTSYLQSGSIQQYVQASRNFINAVLRRESGAVISPTEFAEARKQYLPEPGDDANNLAQKKANRDLILSSYQTGAGSAYQSVDSLLGGDNPLGI